MSSFNPTASELPPLRRVVTGHDERGRSCHLSKVSVAPEPLPNGTIKDALMKVLFTTEETPANNSSAFVDPLKSSLAGGIANERGSILRVIDFLPNTIDKRMHRTNSIDYGIVVSGSIIHTTEDGDSVTLSKGDIMVQRGTMHSWNNASSTETCRMVFVIIAAHPVEIGGKALGEAGFHPEEFQQSAGGS